MRRKGLMILLALFCLLPCIQTAIATKTEPALPKSTITDRDVCKGVTLKLDRKQYARYELTLVATLNNTTNNAYGFGYDYKLEREIDNSWYVLPAHDVPMIGLYLGAKQKENLELSLSDSAGVYSAYGALESGQYRIAWPIQDEKTNETKYLLAEFEIISDDLLFASEPVNLRKGPSMDTETIRELRLGERVTFIQKEGKWSKVIAGSHTGYVFTKYLINNEAAAYYNHPVIKAIGKSRVKSIVRMNDVELRDLQYGFAMVLDNKPAERYYTPVRAEKCFFVNFKKPYDDFMLYFFQYDSGETAKSVAETIKAQSDLSWNELMVAIDRQTNGIFIDGNMLIMFEGRHPIGDYTKAQVAFSERVEKFLYKNYTVAAYSDIW